MDNTKKFDGYADDYTSGRPDYAKELIDCFYASYGFDKAAAIADIGSGTGKLSLGLLRRGSKVYCVEPNGDMRRVAEKELSAFEGFHSVCGDAENTTLDDASVDCITVAQAFHWFDVESFREECKRILKEGGRVFLIWNVRDMSDPVNADLQDVYKKYCPDFVGFSGGIEKDDARIRDFFRGKYEYEAFSNPLVFDREKFIARSLSGSYSIKEGDENFGEYMKAVTDLFDKYENDGVVTMGNSSVAYIGTV